MTKIAGSGSGSISQRHGSADPDPPQNVMDPQHCMKDCSGLDDASLLCLAQGLPHLRRLQIRGSTSVTHDGMLQFVELRGRDLEVVHVKFPASFSLAHLREFLRRCPNLYEIMFTFVGPQGGAEAEADPVDPTFMPRSKITEATLCGLSGANVIAFMPSIGSSLRMLDLDRCLGLSLSKIKLLLDLCPNLEVLWLSLCCCGLPRREDPTAAVQRGGGGSSSRNLTALVLHFCTKVDRRAEKLAGKLLDLLPQVTRLYVKQACQIDLTGLLLRSRLIMNIYPTIFPSF
jgi:hypothetical protein